MDAILSKDSLRHIEKHIPFGLPAINWRFASLPPDNAVMPEVDTWTCMFTVIRTAK